MPSKSTKSWREVRGQKPVNEKLVAAYDRVLEAEERIAQARSRRGETAARIAEALTLSEPDGAEVEVEEDLYLSVLARYVAALGGHLEVHAVFPEETITVRREPAQPSRPDPT